MKRQKYILSIFLFAIINSFIYCQEPLVYKNNLKLSILGLYLNTKLHYERTISKKSTIGLITSVYYLNPLIGIKIEPTYRYYFRKVAPHRGYIESKLSIGYFQTNEIVSVHGHTYDIDNNFINMEIINGELMKWHTFIPVGFSLKVGHQDYFGKNKRFIVDFNFGFQYFPYNYPKTYEEIESYDSDGNRHNTVISDTSKGLDSNTLIWYLVGPGSMINSNLSIGYIF